MLTAQWTKYASLIKETFGKGKLHPGAQYEYWSESTEKNGHGMGMAASGWRTRGVS